MSEIILHHYDMSPYAEKVRVALGLKGLTWHSVQVPVVMPKPELTALTGGYRKTPVLQIGADVYCDTTAILRVLEQRYPTPSLYPVAAAATVRALEVWAQGNFVTAVTLFFGTGDVFSEEFLADRRKMIPGGINEDLARAVGPSMRDHLRSRLTLLEQQLEDGRPYLLGDAASAADLAAYHPIWFLSRSPLTEAALETFDRVRGWRDRIAGFGHGTRSEMDPEEALEVARRTVSATSPTSDPGDPIGRQPGDQVQVMPDDYARDPVAGELVASDAHEIAIRRHDARAGEVVVHFPREGFLTLAA